MAGAVRRGAFALLVGGLNGSWLALFDALALHPASTPGPERGPPSPQHSADTSRSASALQLRRTEREYGAAYSPVSR
jgi:hypothetical protein